MNILLVTNDFYPNSGGISYTLTRICKSIKHRKEKLIVFNPNINGKNLYRFPFHYRNGMTNFHALRKKKFWSLLILGIKNIFRDKKIRFSHRFKIILYLLLKPKLLIYIVEQCVRFDPYIKKLYIDIIFGGHSGKYLLPLIFFLSRIHHKKIVSMGHGNDIVVKSPFSMRTFYYKYVDKFITHTKNLKNIMRRIHHLDENKIEIAPTGLFLEEYEIKELKGDLRKEFDISKDCFIIISVGRHISRKKFDLVIRAIKEIEKINPHYFIQYYLLGEGEFTPNLKKLTQELDLENKVKFLGFCDTSKRNKFYKLSDLFVMPSIREKDSIEGFGVVFLEANYYKLPVIGSLSGGMGESIINGETGFLVKPNDLNDLIEKILYFYENEKERKEMGEKGYKRVIGEYKWEIIIENYINIFKETLKS